MGKNISNRKKKQTNKQPKKLPREMVTNEGVGEKIFHRRALEAKLHLGLYLVSVPHFTLLLKVLERSPGLAPAPCSRLD